jgi:hypothetical protein
MEAGKGYFVDNTSASGIVKLPTSASAGDTISIKDYAGNFGTNNLEIQRNGHKIQGVANNGQITTNRASLTLVYVDSTKGWLYANESNVADLEQKTYTSATGGTVTTSGNFKIHSFTGDGCFVVSSVGNPGGSGAKVSYLVVAGGGGGGNTNAGAGGGGGFREGKNSPVDSYTASPLAAADSGLTVCAQTYPITVGAGGAGKAGGNCRGPGCRGSNSIFSTITSTGGGGGVASCEVGSPKAPGGSGGGASGGPSPAQAAHGTGNTPPVSPSQGNDGGEGGGSPGFGGGGGGGFTCSGQVEAAGGAGGKGIVIIRYKYQN